MSKGPGTYPYMAPEMFRTGHRGPPVDMYSLGCLLIELFGRRQVWPGLDGPDIMVQIMGTYDTPPQMPDTSHLKAPFGTICQQLSVGSCKASQVWGSFENAQRGYRIVIEK